MSTSVGWRTNSWLFPLRGKWAEETIRSGVLLTCLFFQVCLLGKELSETMDQAILPSRLFLHWQEEGSFIRGRLGNGNGWNLIWAPANISQRKHFPGRRGYRCNNLKSQNFLPWEHGLVIMGGWIFGCLAALLKSLIAHSVKQAAWRCEQFTWIISSLSLFHWALHHITVLNCFVNLFCTKIYKEHLAMISLGEVKVYFSSVLAGVSPF